MRQGSGPRLPGSRRTSQQADDDISSERQQSKSRDDTSSSNNERSSNKNRYGIPPKAGFHYPRHPSNEKVFADFIMARSLFESINARAPCPILDGLYDDDELRHAAYDGFLRIVVYDDHFRGVRYILDDMMRGCLPKRHPRCLFGGRSPRDEIQKWPMFLHDEFNAFLARADFDHRSILDKLWDDRLDHLAVWLMGCADAHFINVCDD